MSESTLGKALLVLARNAIAAELGANTAPATTHPNLAKQGACFVTLTQHGQLRGCIGSLEARRPLIDDVRANAIAAAFNDPRFPPLGLMELPRTRIEVSLLTAPEPLSFSDEGDALARLRPYTDGVILEYGAHRSTFLPQVWEQLPEPEVFINHLKQKAGLPAHFWSPEIRLQRYGVQKWSET